MITKMDMLPKNLYVGRNMHLSGTNIDILPNNTYIGGNVYHNKDIIIDGSIVKGQVNIS